MWPSQRKVNIDSYLVLLGGVVVISLLLRLPFLDVTSLWLDEIWSIGTSRMPWRSVMSVIAHQDLNMSLYYALLHFWIGLGDGEGTVRLLSVIPGVAAVPVLYALGKRLFGSQTGVIASLLLAVNGFHIWASQEARSYSLLVFLSLLATLFFVRYVERPTRLNWLGYVLTSVLAIYAHLFAILVLASHWGSLVFLRRREAPWKGLLSSAAAIGVLAAPLGLLVLVFARAHSFPLGWIPKLTWHRVYEVFYSLLGARVGGAPRKSVVAAYFVVCAFGLLSGIRLWRCSRNSSETWRVGLLFTWLLLPMGLVFAISIVKPLLVPRYLLIGLPPLLLVAAKGIQSIRPRLLATVALTATVGLPALALPLYYQSRSDNQVWKAATGYILAHARPGDAAIFCAAPGRLLFDYYRGRHEGSAKNLDIVYPESLDENKDPRVLAYMPPVRGELMDHIATHYHRVWVVLYPDNATLRRLASQRILGELSARYRKITECKIDWGTECKITGGTDSGVDAVALLLYSNGSIEREATTRGSRPEKTEARDLSYPVSALPYGSPSGEETNGKKERGDMTQPSALGRGQAGPG